MTSIAVQGRADWDEVLVAIVDYVERFEPRNELAWHTARHMLLDSLGCAFEALQYPACTKLLGPVVPGATLANGARVPGTGFELDPVKAAFDIGTTIRWLDFNDTWLAAEWGHPSDNLGAILALADWRSRNGAALTMRDVLECAIKAHEIQGVLALRNSFNQVGLDHVALVKLASTAVACRLLELDRAQSLAALSQVFVDGQALRTYRHAPNTGSRKSWAAGDATSRAVRLALIARSGEMGYPSALTAPAWGFYDVSFQGRPFRFEREFASYVIENVLFKISYPAEFHAQSAVEAALTLQARLAAMGRGSDDIAAIVIRTQAACDTCHTTRQWQIGKFNHTGIVQSCSSCHNGVQSVGKSASHIATVADCAACHTTASFDAARFDHTGVTGNCASCHNGTKASGKSTSHITTTNACEALARSA